MAIDRGDESGRIAAAASSGGCERFAVEGATVVCTQMFEGESNSKMTPASGIVINGANELIHTDVEFEPKFEKCKYDYEDCEPDIESGEWHDYSESNLSNGGYGILEEQSFMVCLKGYGMLYVSEDGQRPSDAKRLLAKLLIKLGDRRLLGLLMHAAFSRDPVNLATGNFIFARTDLEIPGSIPLKYERFYNTMDDYIGPHGKGWYHPYDIKLSLIEEGVSIRFEDGHEEIFKVAKGAGKPISKNKEESTKAYHLSKPGETLDNPDDENHKGEDGNFKQLIKSGNIYRLVKPDGANLHFDEAGNLTKIQDKDQVETILTYEENKLINVVSLCGSLMFIYDSDKIIALKDHTGREITYTYEGDLLTSVTDSLGNVRTYAYDEHGRFISEINPEGNTFVKNDYDEDSRTIKQTFADGSEMTYEYDDEAKTTIFVGGNGAKTVYKRDELYRTTSIEYIDGGEEQFELNDMNQKISETDRMGTRTYYDFDEKGNIKLVTNPYGDMTKMIYDKDNKLVKISVNGMLRLHCEYDKVKNLTSIKDGLGRQVRFTYDKERKRLPTQIAQLDGGVVNIKYDERNNVTEVTDPQGIKAFYEYDSLNRIVKTIDGNGNITCYEYDSNNNITNVTNAEGNSCIYTYNKANKVVGITDFNGGQVKIDYNNLGKPSAITNQLGRTTHLTYDKLWNVNKIVMPNGAETKFIYDEINRLTNLEKPDKNTIEYEYDKNGNQTKVIVKTDDGDNVIFLTYDKLNRLIEVSNDEGVKAIYTYNADGQVTSVTDAMENTAYLTYDEVGQLISETNALGDSRSYTYTALGNIETIEDEANRITKYEYELGGRIKNIHHPLGTIESFTYDNNGNIKTHISETGQKTTFVYDSLNRVIKSIGENGGSKKYTYDAAGNVTSMTNELEHTTYYEYSLTGKLTKVIDPLCNETFYFYDSLDQLIEVKQLKEVKDNDAEINGNKSNLMSSSRVDKENRITKYKRNLLGQVESTTDALGNVERYKYSATGHLIQKIDKDGYLTRYAYTKQGDVNHIAYADGKEVSMSYNSLRQLTEVKDWLGITAIEVDPLGRATKVTNHKGETVDYTYGKVGERRSITYPDGKVVNYHYDEALRLTQLQDGENFTNYIYDEYNRLIEKQYPNKVMTKYEFNSLGQLKTLIHSQSRIGHNGKEFIDILDQFHYKYDLCGNKVEINKIRKGLNPDNQGRYEYQYDVLSRLVAVMCGYDTLRAYQYDAFGNRTRLLEKDKSTLYTYNNLNQLIATHGTGGDNQTYFYDRRGNLTETYQNDTLTHRYHFGALNRLESVFNFTQHMGALYHYNGLGHRVGKRVGFLEKNVIESTAFTDIMIPTKTYCDDVIDLTRQYHNLLQRTDGEVIYSRTNENEYKEECTNFTYDFNVLSATNGKGVFQYLHDNLGSPVRLLDGLGNEKERLNYDEFGNLLLSTNINQPFGFTGYQMDEISNTLYAQAREYDSTTGRFGAEDVFKGEMILPISLNAYSYCVNNPIRLVDFDGFLPTNSDDYLVCPEVYARAMGAYDVTMSSQRSGYRGSVVTNTATITYGDVTKSFTLDGNSRIPYSEVNAAFGWENPWIPNNRTYQAFLGSHPVFYTPFHHSSLVIFALPDCPVFGDYFRFRNNSFSNVNFMAIGGGGEFNTVMRRSGRLRGGYYGQSVFVLTGEFDRCPDLDLSIKNEMLALDINSDTINRMIENTMNFQNSPNLMYVPFPTRISDNFNSGSFLAGLFNSVGITDTPGTFSPGWGAPVPNSFFESEPGE